MEPAGFLPAGAEASGRAGAATPPVAGGASWDHTGRETCVCRVTKFAADKAPAESKAAAQVTGTAVRPVAMPGGAFMPEHTACDGSVRQVNHRKRSILRRFLCF